MKNTYKIIWSDEALKKLAGIIEYLDLRWTAREIRNFSRLLDRQINLIQMNPELFPTSSTSNGLRKAVLTKQTTIFYRFDDLKIKNVTLFDNRQNPLKMKKY